MSEPDINFWRDKIRELLKRVPRRVNSGGYQTSVDYKAAVTYANKCVSGARTSISNMRSAAQKLQAYED